MLIYRIYLHGTVSLLFQRSVEIGVWTLKQLVNKRYDATLIYTSQRMTYYSAAAEVTKSDMYPYQKGNK